MDPEDAVLLDRLTALRIPDDLEHRFRANGNTESGMWNTDSGDWEHSSVAR